jgi:hypothetical protein
MRENVDFQFRAEFLNASNHPSFSGINTYIGSGVAFGGMNSARDPRLIQFGLKVQL